jgi:RNA polymerase sigma-70 factor (ECF subfamily)
MHSTQPQNSARAGGHCGVIDWVTELARHQRWLRTVVGCRVHDSHAVDDVMQEVALATLKPETRPTEPGRVAPWLYRVAVRQAISHRRRQQRNQNLVAAAARNGRKEEAIEDPRDWVLQEETRGTIQAALEQLTAQDRQILLLKYTEKWCYRQLAQHLGVGLDAVEYRLLRAKRRFRARLRKCDVLELES